MTAPVCIISKGRIAYEEKPTVTDTPLQGDQFVNRLLTRVSLNTLLLLDGGGWSTRRVLRVCMEAMNGLDHASRASGPTPDKPPEFTEFLEAVGLLAEFSDTGAVYSVNNGNAENPEFTYRLRKSAFDSPSYGRLMQLLQIDPSIGEYPITINANKPNANTINVRTRSYLGIMYFLSHGTDIPADDADAGYVTVTPDNAGFDATRGRMNKRSQRRSSKRPLRSIQ